MERECILPDRDTEHSWQKTVGVSSPNAILTGNSLKQLKKTRPPYISLYTPTGPNFTPTAQEVLHSYSSGNFSEMPANRQKRPFSHTSRFTGPPTQNPHKYDMSAVAEFQGTDKTDCTRYGLR